MNLIDDRTRNIGEMALNGLYERQKAISANTVNALTPGYQRQVVSFEKSLQDIIKREDEKEELKIQNSQMYDKNPQRILKGLPPEQIAFLNTEVNQDFIIDVDKDWAEPNGLTENNVNIEREMMDEAKNGMQYQVIAGLLSKSYAQMNTIIKGQNQ